jgi:hypothetical protein
VPTRKAHRHILARPQPGDKRCEPTVLHRFGTCSAK